MTFIRLSYILSGNTPAYGNGAHPEVFRINDMQRGATANKTALRIDSHTGTHMDFPLHFLADGKAGETYHPQDFIFSHVRFAEVKNEGGLITVKHFSNLAGDEQAELLLVKTGFCNRRNETAYWQNNPGFAADTAARLKTLFPNLRAIGFDSISLSSYQNREEGRKAHREFLSRDILIIEDMDLRTLDADTVILKVLIAPLLFESCDGAPCYVLAEVR